MTGSRDNFLYILEAARMNDASDVHLIAGLPPALRCQGDIHVVTELPMLTAESLVEMTRNILSEDQMRRLEEERELCVSWHGGEVGRVRLALYARLNGFEMSIRLCRTQIPTAEDLMLPPIVEELTRRRSGLILVTGPTGSGKTTSLNFMIDAINATRPCRILTIEDPVEYEHSHRRSVVTQIEVGTDSHSFQRSLRHALRLDPDVIAIGEIRDQETMETALAAAETGHLVIATLHTPSAVSTAERILGIFDGAKAAQANFQLASSLVGIVSQRLVPTIDKNRLVLAVEILLATDAVRHLIRENNYHQLSNVIAGGRSTGMMSMEKSLVDLYQRGVITYDQAIAHANRVEDIEGLLRRKAG